MTDKKRILIVEDEAVIAMDVKEILEKLGYEAVGPLATGEEAVEKAGEARPDLILMDIHLAGDLDGIETAREIRERFDIPVIYVTAFADNELIRRAKITDPFGYILKPFSRRDLQSNISIALYKHQAEKNLRDALDKANRLNKVCLNREFRIKELRDEVKALKREIASLKG